MFPRQHRLNEEVRISGAFKSKASLIRNATVSQDIDEDLGDTWVEFGVGANINWTENTYTYIDLERSNGGDIKENWRWNVGIRHTFSSVRLII